MLVFLIRHAHAGSRSSWQGDDAHRPLSGRGRDQAERLIPLIEQYDITRVASSPATRCIQTVEPIAERLGLEVELDKRLAEGADLRGGLDVVLKGPGGRVLCAHGDLIPEIMQRLLQDGMHARGVGRCQKGSMWEIEVDDGRAVKAVYHEPARRS